jgi:jasmonate ZIM domain-containing protein
MFSLLYRDVAGPSEMLRRSPSTMNLFPMSEKPGHISCQNMGAPRNFTSMDLFPQQAGFAPKEDVPKKLDSRCVWIYYVFYPWDLIGM